MSHRSLSVIKAIKLALDIALVLCVLFEAGIAIWILVSPLVMQDGHHDAWIFLGVAMDDLESNAEPALMSDDAETAAPSSSEPFVDLGKPPVLENVFGILSARTDDWFTQFVVWTVTLLVIGVGIWEVLLLRRMVKTAIEGRPFAEANALRLQLIGIIILAGGIVGPIALYAVGKVALESVVWSGPPLKPLLRFEPWVVLNGLMILGLATVFRHGRRLEEEQSLTV